MPTKLCRGCQVEKLVTEFRFNDKAKKYRRSKCVPCDYNRPRSAAYAKGRGKEYAIRAKTLRQSLMAKTFDYLKSNPCVDCGEADPVVLQFDHISDKDAAVSRLISRRRKWATIQREIAKCEVRCANCHFRKTAKQQGWYAYL